VSNFISSPPLTTRETRLEISLSALQHNLEYYKNQLPATTKVMAMVKANAYGLGDFEITTFLEKNGVDYFGVAYLEEGILLRNYGISVPILVMNPSIRDFEKATQFDLELNIASFEMLDEFERILKQKNHDFPPISIHLKVDTGMHRLGFLPNEIEKLIYKLQKISFINIKGVCSHLAMPTNERFTIEQITLFYEIAERFEIIFQKTMIKHIINSAGLPKFVNSVGDMVRLGIGLYGIGNFLEATQNLKTIACLKTKISQIKIVQKGDTVGYGRKGKITKSYQKIAILSIGYADGFDRRFGNGTGKVQVYGKFAPVIGNICMDMTMIDITGLEVKVGDEVIIFGKNLTISELAQQIGTIPYEILTNVHPRIPRIASLNL